MRVLVVKLSSLGDALHALPAVAELKAQLGAEVHWAVQPAFAALVRRFACVDEVLEVPRPSDLAGFLRALRALRTRRYDLVVDLQGLMKSALVARAARAPRRIGPSFAREGSRLFYHELAGHRDKSRHAVEECLDIVRHLGLAMPAEPRFPLDVPAIDLDALRPVGNVTTGGGVTTVRFTHPDLLISYREREVDLGTPATCRSSGDGLAARRPGIAPVD